VPGNDLAEPVHQEFGEIPGDVGLAGVIRHFRFQPLIQVAGAVAVDVDLGKHREVGVVAAFRKLEDFGVAPGLLGPKLVARKREDRESFRTKRLLQSTQPGVLGSESSAARYVDDQTVFAGEVRQGDRIAFNVVHGQFMESGHACLLH